MLIAERAAHAAERSRLVEQNDRLLHTLRQLRRNQFGRKSERLSDDQLNLGLEDLETAIASGEAAQERADATLTASRKRVPQSQSRSSSRAPAARGGGDRAGEQGLPVLWR